MGYEPVPRPDGHGDGRGNSFRGYEITQGREYSEATAKEVDEEIEKILAVPGVTCKAGPPKSRQITG